MQVTRSMLLYDEAEGVRGDDLVIARRLSRPGEVAFGLVAGEFGPWHERSGRRCHGPNALDRHWTTSPASRFVNPFPAWRVELQEARQ